MYGENNKITDPGAMRRLLAFWERMHTTGTAFYLDGEELLPSEMYERSVQEECSYMADYVVGDTGEITQVRLDRVEPQ